MKLNFIREFRGFLRKRRQEKQMLAWRAQQKAIEDSLRKEMQKPNSPERNKRIAELRQRLLQ
ncbi:MAG: hypothetical protein HYW05_04135 [Candidatus Diapherotrites archaeon]|nr:hypothetical protein [Candidatus Diapherotrites archaeon]